MAISLGGAVAPAATPLRATPNIRLFNVTALDADTGPTAFNHGVQAADVNQMFAFLIPNVVVAIANNWGITWTLTQVTITKFNVVGSGGGVPGTTVVATLVVFNMFTGIQ